MTEDQNISPEQQPDSASELISPSKSSKASSGNWASRAWKSTTSRVGTLLPINPFTRWFQVSESEIAEILARVRQNLPTTEALLIGKPQAGKSSIVRGLTGVSAEIVGQGFRPHTQNTE
ncbi:MAG: hypothetical protein WBA57_23395, partial [Elainellaceae cyanobacterium]